MNTRLRVGPVSAPATPAVESERSTAVEVAAPPEANPDGPTPVHTGRPGWAGRLRPRGWSGWVLAAVAAVACGARTLQWYAGAALAGDDIALLYSIRALPFRRLFGPLILNQGAPPAWTVSERVLVELLGSGDRVVRLIPVVFGCLSVVAVAFLARAALSRVAAIVATVLFACAPMAIHYSWQVKPYSADMAATAGILAVAVWLSRQPRWSYWHGLALWLTAAVAAGFSFPSMFVTVSSAVILVLHRLFGRVRQGPDAAMTPAGGFWTRLAESARFCLPAIAWGGTVAAVYVTQLRVLKGSQNHHPFWVHAFGPLDASLSEQATWSWQALSNFVDTVYSAPKPWVAIVLMLVGSVALWWRERVVGALLTAPIVVALAAAFAQSYPLKHRLALWLLPVFVVLFAGSVFPSQGGAGAAGRPARRLPRWMRGVEAVIGVAVVALLAATLLVPAAKPLSMAFDPPGRFTVGTDPDNTTFAVDVIARQYRPGDTVLVTVTQYHRVYWYGHPHGIAPAAALTASQGGCDPDAIDKTVKGARRVWLVTGSPWVLAKPTLPELAVAKLRTLGKVREVAHDGAVHVYVADLPQQPDQRATRAGGAEPCLATMTLPRWLG